MSATEIYTVGKAHCELIGEVKNSWRGAMYVWDHIAQKYFGLEFFPNFDKELQRQIWNADQSHPLTEAEKVVLASTMDGAVVKASDLDRLIHSFVNYGEEHPRSSIREQAILLQTIKLQGDYYIAWNQSDVGDFDFAAVYDEEEQCYKYSELQGAWDLFSKQGL